jgi:N-methylhydantoinase B/oxoprolinase/acetone carboxylase alpha subunit
MARSRALITEKEREHIAGEHGDRRKYEAVSRVRARINDELTTDIEVLESNHPELLEELRDIVCKNK